MRSAGEALHPNYELLAALEKLRQDMGAEIFSAQYQQAPVPLGGAMIKRDWLKYYDKAPEPKYKKIIQSWDTAAKDGPRNSWSVCTTWLVHDDHYYLLDLTRGRYKYTQLRETAVMLAKRFKPRTILIEDASTGQALAEDLRGVVSSAVRPIPVNRDKTGRLYIQAAKFETGRVLFPKGASFLPVLEAELLAFPQSKTTDQVDSISQALAHKLSGYDRSMSWVG